MQREREPHRILVVGQTPPPFGGQAVMVEALLNGRFERIRPFHVRMAFSDDMDSVGRFAVRKIWILATTILRVWWGRIRHRTSVLYYPPAGPNMVPVLRDIALLCATRWMFRYVVFHFHAGGLSGFQQKIPWLLRPLYRAAYMRPALAIRTAPQNPDDGAAFGADRNVVIPNGIPDHRGRVPEGNCDLGEPVVILFTGVLIRSKGVSVLLEAFHALRGKGLDVRLQLMGRWGDSAFERECLERMARYGIADRVECLGVLSGDEKLTRFAACDIFCFPTFFEAESFGLVLLEAMQFAKPVVSTWWRGVPSVVEHGRNGSLVPPQDARILAEALAALVLDGAQRKRMGDEGRRIFEERFTLDVFHASMEKELLGLFMNE